MADRPGLRRLADQVGILPGYVDVQGKRRITSDSTRELLLAAMGLDGSTEALAEAARSELIHAERRSLLPPVHVVHQQNRRRSRIRFSVPGESAAPVDWSLELRLEGGAAQTVRGRSKPRSSDGAVFVTLPERPPDGYHSVELTADLATGPVKAEQTYIVSPGRCTAYSEKLGGDRAYGIWTNLYSVRSRRNWGVGDLTDLQELALRAARHGASFVGLNPLHALRNCGKWIGPYCPLSRRYRNLIYLDVEGVPEFAECPAAQERLRSAAFQTRLAEVRDADLIEYEQVAAFKVEILRLVHDTFIRRAENTVSDRSRAYAAYVSQQGRALQDYATFMALDAWLRNRGELTDDSAEWPNEYRDPRSSAVDAFRAEHRREIDFHCYVQFELDRQLGETARAAAKAGMKLGLYPDLALGSAADGSDAWARRDVFLTGVRVGAPPDPYSETGQTWGFPPLDPRGLRAGRYEYWVQLLRGVLAHAGMLRIDHVMGLFRQYWVPEGLKATEGAYVRYPADDLLGILALESRRHQAVIVGEDLGTVPRELPSILARWGILSSRVMYFERNRHGGFRPASSYSHRALATVTTHDHSPLAGFWAGRDLQIRRELGLIDSDASLSEARNDRERTRAALLRRLLLEGILSDVADVSPVELCRAVHQFLARTPCPLIGISLDDLDGETDPINLPGVDLTQYPSWSRKMRRNLEDILRDRTVCAILDELERVSRQPSAVSRQSGS